MALSSKNSLRESRRPGITLDSKTAKTFRALKLAAVFGSLIAQSGCLLELPDPIEKEGDAGEYISDGTLPDDVRIRPDVRIPDAVVPPDDARVVDAAPIDAAPHDAGIDATPTDARIEDAHVVDALPIDAALPDSTPPMDAGLPDTAVIDARIEDALPVDAAPVDAHVIDALPIDAAIVDATPIDAQLLDAAIIDASIQDAALIDAAGPEEDSGPHCIPAQERCDGLDNDCDLAIDEDGICQIGQPCTAGVGPCQVIGEVRQDMSCSAVPLQPQTEICNNIDDDCDGQIDNDVIEPMCETACGQGVIVCTAGGNQHCNAPTAVAENVAPRCDGVDNNCNGQVDEGLFCADGQPCEVGVGACRRAGIIERGQCNAVPNQPTPERCDGLDNDCDGQTDEDSNVDCSTDCGVGVRICRNGQLAACDARNPSAEICDGQDNNCDPNRLVDEGCGIGNACTVGTGICRVNGTIQVDPNNIGQTRCDIGNQQVPNPQQEICDSLDNDCDGQIDESFPEANNGCEVGIGECATQGNIICRNGALTCSATAGNPVAEICNQLDDNCNGQVDEGDVCMTGECRVSQDCPDDGNRCNGVPYCSPDFTCVDGEPLFCGGTITNACPGPDRTNRICVIDRGDVIQRCIDEEAGCGAVDDAGDLRPLQVQDGERVFVMTTRGPDSDLAFLRLLAAELPKLDVRGRAGRGQALSVGDDLTELLTQGGRSPAPIVPVQSVNGISRFETHTAAGEQAFYVIGKIAE